jgi:NADH dehydrogenase
VLPLNDTASYWFARLMELKPGAKIMTRDNFYAMQNDNICPAGCTPGFGIPTPLESVIGYLKEAHPRWHYHGFRGKAGR